MDERLEKAFDTANYMATLSNQRRVIKEEFNQKLMYYTNGGSFKIKPKLITFTKTLIDLGHVDDVVFIDENHLPIVIANVPEFFESIVNAYFGAVNEYAAKLADIKSKRKLTDIISL